MRANRIVENNWQYRHKGNLNSLIASFPWASAQLTRMCGSREVDQRMPLGSIGVWIVRSCPWEQAQNPTYNPRFFSLAKT